MTNGPSSTDAGALAQPPRNKKLANKTTREKFNDIIRIVILRFAARKRMLASMVRLRRSNFARYGAVIIFTILTACSQPVFERPDVAPVVPGLHGTNLPSELRGRVLLGELGCTACHDAGSAQIERRAGPDLEKVGERLHASYLRSFLTSPHAMEPGTAMPNVTRHLNGTELDNTAEALAHYLRSHASAGPVQTAIDLDAAERGAKLYDTIGCRSCHFATGDSRHLQAQKYTVISLQSFLLDPHDARPSARMPAMALSPTEAYDLANHLMQQGGEPIGGDISVDEQKATAGRSHFAKLGCANCHALADTLRSESTAAQPLSSLNTAKGCLSGQIGAWPHYALDKQQTDDLRGALASLETPLAPEARVQQLMASRNCFACHERGEVDTVSARQDDFTTRDASLGQDGRLPPTLTGVGSKLQDDWLHNSIAHGQLERPYLVTRMPGFGDAFATELHSALITVDKVPEFSVTPLPEPRKEAEVITKLGGELIGDKGMNCITCHLFAGEQAGAMGGIDLVHSTGKRLRPEWFAGFLRHPYRFKPATLMPKFYPDGKSTRPEIADGDPQKQIDAMWHYLAKGRNVRKPRGMSHPPIELKVANEAVMLRRSVQNTGKRGISVGYPGGVNITFDAETLAMNQVWWGRFVDARPVWTGQGSGQASILSRDRGTLPKGPTFAQVDNDQPWPTATRRDRGDQFRGYNLDEQQRPTFRYTSGEISVEDTPRELITEGQTQLQRTMVITGTWKLVHFLAARHKQIEKIDDKTVRVGKSLQIEIANHLFAIVPAGEEKELRVMINIEHNAVEVDLTYSWAKEGK